MVKVLLTQFEEHDRKIFWTLCTLVLVFLSLYVYFLSVSVYAVVSRKSAENTAGTLNARIAQLESEYAILDKHIDLALAHERGFVDIAVPKYLFRDKPESSLSLRGALSESR